MVAEYKYKELDMCCKEWFPNSLNDDGILVQIKRKLTSICHGVDGQTTNLGHKL